MQFIHNIWVILSQVVSQIWCITVVSQQSYIINKLE